MAKVSDPGSVSEYEASVVRLFSGWAESAIWFSGPVAYDDTRLEAELVADLRSWDDSFYAGLTSSYDWRSPDLATRYHQAGARLARRVADQIGDDFQVQYDLGTAQKHRVRAVGAAHNRDAAAAFLDMATRARAESLRLHEIVAHAESSGQTLSWHAYPPQARP